MSVSTKAYYALPFMAYPRGHDASFEQRSPRSFGCSRQSTTRMHQNVLQADSSNQVQHLDCTILSPSREQEIPDPLHRFHGAIVEPLTPDADILESGEIIVAAADIFTPFAKVIRQT